MTVRLCENCGKEYLPAGSNQRWCIECQPEMRKRQHIACDHRRYYENPEKAREKAKVNRAAHPETMKKWCIDNLERKRKDARDWLHLHLGYSKRWNQTHPEGASQCWRRAGGKRRSLGFVPLNEWFNGCEGHHVDNEQVVFLPKALHRGIYHRQDTGQGMEKINALALNYLFKEEVTNALRA